MRPHTPAEARRGARHDRARGRTRLPRRARSPDGLRGRRVLPPGRPAVPRRRRVRGLPAARERHRHGRARSTAEVRAALAGRAGRRASGPAPGSSPGSTARRPTGYRAPRDRARCARGPRRVATSAARRVAIAHRRVRRRGCSRRSLAGARPRTRAPSAARCRSATGSSAATSPSPACSTGADVAAALGDRARGAPRTCCPTSCCREGRFLDGTAARRPAPAGRGRRRPTARRSSRRCARPRARRWPDLMAADPVVAVVGRPNVGKSHAREPHRRPTRGDRRGAAGRHPRPQGARRRVERPVVPRGRHRRLARRAASRPRARQVSRQAERAVAEADVVLLVVDVTVGRHRGGRRRRAASLRRRRARRCCSSPTRSTTTAASATSGRSRSSASAIPYPCQRAARSGERRPARRASSARAAAAEPATRRAEPEGDEPTQAVLGRDRRPAERRQVDAVQPARRRGARRRARHARHDARHDRHRRRDRRTGRSASSTPPACGARAASTRPTEYYSLVRALRVGRPRRRRPARDRRHRGRHRTRTSASPSGSTPPGCRDRRRAQQVGPARTPSSAGTSRTQRRRPARASSATRRSLKVSALTGRNGAPQAAARAARGRSRRTTAGSRPRRSTR